GGLPQATGITLSADGRRILRQQGPGRDFARVQDHPCQESHLPPPGACRSRLKDCMEHLADRRLPAPVCRSACSEGVAFACLRWVETGQLDAAGVALQARAKLTRGPAVDVLAEPPALADDVLEQLPAICERHR